MSDEQASVILIIDDDDSIRTLLKLGITNKGYSVEEAVNGEEGISVYQRCQPDLILLDAMMPVMDGFDCCQKICQLAKKNNQTSPPILMLTFLDDKDSIDKAFTAGATDYITKPIFWAVLFQRVNRLLSASQDTLKLDQLSTQLQKSQEYESLFHELLNADNVFSQAILDKIRSYFDVDRALFYLTKSKVTMQSFADNLSAINNQDISNLLVLDNDRYQEEKIVTIAQRQPLLIDNLEQGDLNPDIQFTLNNYQINSGYIIPILSKKKITALLCLYRSKNNRATVDKNQLKNLGNLITLKIN